MSTFLTIVSVIVAAFIITAMYYALRFPNGKWFPSGRDKLLRKVGPLATGTLERLNVRYLTRAGGVPRLLFNADYRYEVKGQPYTITLPLESEKLDAPRIKDALTTREHEREVAERLVLEDGTTLEGRETIRQYYSDRLQARTPTVQVLYDKGAPALSTVRDWR
jgi:hypothetical protein